MTKEITIKNTRDTKLHVMIEPVATTFTLDTGETIKIAANGLPLAEEIGFVAKADQIDVWLYGQSAESERSLVFDVV